MNFLKKIKSLDRYDSILLAVYLIFIVFNLDVPDILGNIFEANMLAQLLLIGIALSLFVVSNPIVGVVGLLAVYELLRRSSRNNLGLGMGSNSSLSNINQSVPMELNNNIDDNNLSYNSTTSLNTLDNSPSLEQQVVSNMAPPVYNENLGTPSYLPIIDSNINGSDINEPDVF
jgi:hypothetical protein